MNFLIAMILSALLGALGGSHAAERAIKNRLESQFHPRTVKVDISRGHRSPTSKTLDRLQIDLEGFKANPTPGGAPGLEIKPGDALMVGRINRVAVNASDFEVAGLPVREMSLSLVNLRYDLWRLLIKRRLRVLSFENRSEVSVTLTEASLQRYLAPRVKELEGMDLDLLPGRVRVSGRVGVSLLQVPLSISGRLEPAGGRIYLRDPEMAVTVVPVPGFITERIIAQVNPLVDLNQDLAMPISLRLRRITVSPSGLSVTAGLAPAS